MTTRSGPSCRHSPAMHNFFLLDFDDLTTKPLEMHKFLNTSKMREGDLTAFFNKFPITAALKNSHDYFPQAARAKRSGTQGPFL